jgi:ricin-type beta-trefoil lectin protein
MKYLIQFGVILAIVLSVMPAASASAAVTYPQPPQSYYHSLFKNVQNGLCIQPEYEAPINGLGIVQQLCNEADLYQRWTFQTVRLDYGQPGIYLIINSGSGQCLDDRDGATADWSPVQQWTCNFTSTTMQWTLVDPGRPFIGLQFRNLRSGKCLDVRGGSGAPGAVLQIYRCTSTPTAPNYAQLFTWSRSIVIY